MKKISLIDIARRRFFIKSLLWMILLTSPYSSTLGQIMNNLPKNSVLFIEPPMPDGYQQLPRLCNFVQSPDYQHTVWQCVLPQTFSIAPEEIQNKITWESSWMIPIGTDGGLDTPNSFDALHNLVADGIYAYDIGEILAINNQNEWLARPLAKLPSSTIDYGKLSIVKPSISASQQYDMQEISGFPSSNILHVWNIPNADWLIQHNRNVRQIPPILFTQLDQSGKITANREMVEMDALLGTVISKNGYVISWGAPRDIRDKTLVTCQSHNLKATAKTTIDYPPDQQLIGLALPNNEVLLLNTEVKDKHPALTGWIINAEQGCQARSFGTIPLPSHFEGRPFVSWVQKAIILPTGDVVLFYTQQWDIRNIDFERSPSREITRANLWALKFNVTSQKIIWDKLVISSEDPTSEAFSINLTDNMTATSVSYDPGLSVAYLPNLAEIWINPTFPQDRERQKYFPTQPRIYQLKIE